MSFLCPECKSPMRATQTRAVGSTIHRRRVCSCGKRITTVEMEKGLMAKEITHKEIVEMMDNILGDYELRLLQGYAEIRRRLLGKVPPSKQAIAEAIEHQEAEAAPAPAPAPKPEKIPYSGRTKEVIVEVLEKHGMTLEMIRRKGRKVVIVDCRMELAYRLRTEVTIAGLPMPYASLGEILNKDHTTCINYVAQYSKRHGLANPVEGRGGERFVWN